jgi:hypothetical protein
MSGTAIGPLSDVALEVNAFSELSGADGEEDGSELSGADGEEDGDRGAVVGSEVRASIFRIVGTVMVGTITSLTK